MKILFTILTALAVVVTATTIPPRANKEEVNGEEVIPSASVGNVEVAATVQEVKSDWIEDDGTALDNDGVETDDEDEDAPELGDEDEHHDDDGADERAGDEEEEGFVEEDDYEDLPSQDGFEDNVPFAIHDSKDVIINRDNLLPVLKTIVLAYTHKIKPSYTDILKAGGISAFKTGFKYFGKEDLGISLLKMAKKLTSALDEGESDDANAEILSQLAEDYLSSHRFKLVLPESVLLKQKEMDEFLDTKDLAEGRSIVSNRQFDIAMPRADPAVQTILTIGPMTWMAVIGGLFSIPWLLSGSDEQERVDHVIPNPSPYLRAPGLPFFQTHQLRRDENERVPHQQVDQEYLEYQKNYAEWYNNWYLKYKSYYDEHYPNHQQPPPQTIQPGQQHQPLTSLDVMVPPPPAGAPIKNLHQKPIHPPQKPLPPKHQLPKQPPPIQFPQVAGVNARNAAAGAHVVNTAENNKQNSFGTFQSERNKGDSHFRVISGPEASIDGTGITSPTTLRPRAPNPPSPQPVYIPPSESPLIESGFKPITQPNSPNAEKSTGPVQDEKSEFKAPKEETLLSKHSSSSSKAKTSGQTETAEKTAGGFKPIAPPTDAKKQDVETSTLRVSGVTSGIFKTTPNPASAAGTTPRPSSANISGGIPSDFITPRPAVFVRTATQKSVRVVTSSSFVVPEAAPLTAAAAAAPAPGSQNELPDLKRPQRHQQSNPVPQQIPTEVKNEQSIPLHQRLPQHQQQQQQPVQQPKPQFHQQQQPVQQPVQQPTPQFHHQQQPVQQPKPQFQHQQQPVQQPNPQFQHQQQPLPLQQRPPQQPLPLQQGPIQHQQFPPNARPQDEGIGFVRTNVPTSIQVVEHRPAQGFGFGSKPSTEAPTTTTPMPIYALDPFYGARLSRTDVIFHQLGVEDEGCREQVVCNIYKNPDVYTPFSDFLSRQLTVKLEELQKPKVSDERILRFFRYLKAAREGQNGSDCNAKYPECHFDTTSLSHKPIMNAFQKVSLLINAGSS